MTPPKNPRTEIHELAALLGRAAADGKTARLLPEIFTPAELRDLALRLRLLRMLAGGVPQRKIAATLGISLCKITRGSRILKDPASVVAHLLEKT
ncbi:MAG: trp operon repressor [Kiritimatiellaeota bacterium]|nr:trp operon repressor [Kiritimatiellota bacterium]